MEGERKRKTGQRATATGKSTRPKAWQLLWLDKHREELVTRLQSVVMTIADRFVQEGYINPALDEAYQFIQASHSLPVQKSRRFLIFLRSRPSEVFENFQKALSQCGCHDLVPTDVDVKKMESELESLPPFKKLALELEIPEGVVEARKLLHDLYMDTASEVHMLADVSRGGSDSLKDLDEVFVNIGLMPSNEVEKVCARWTGKDGGVEEILSRALQERPIDLCNLLEAEREGGKEPARVMALGTAGSGKSFAFTVKATYEWGRGKFWKKIVLLRTIQCRDKSVWRAKTVSELFRLRELGLSAEQSKEVEAFVREHPKHVALVCDGLDEGSVDEDSFLWRIMSGTSLRGLRVIITSRPCLSVSDLSFGGSIQLHVQLFGFSKENVQEFAVKYLGHLRGQAMLSQLEERPAVLSLMHTPFFAVLICDQFQEAGQLPRRRIDIFSSVALRVVRRFAKRRGLPSNFQHVEKAPEELYKLVLEVGKVAFERLKRKDLSYFELGDERLSSEAVELGFLEQVQATSSTGEDRYGFRHLTVQEYMASLYVCAAVLKCEGDVARLVDELGCGEESGHLNTFWVFVAALLDTRLQEELFCSIMGKAVVPSSCTHRFDHVEEEAPVLESAEAADLDEGSEPLSGVVQKSKTGPQAEVVSMYRFLLLLHCYVEVIADCPQKHSAVVEGLVKEQGVCCQNYPALSLADLRVISRVIEYHGDIVEKLDIEGCYVGDEGIEQLLVGLQSCSHLREVNLRENDLTEQHMPGVRNTLARNGSSLSAINLSFNRRIGNKGLHILACGLQEVRQLKTLHLEKLGLTQKSSPVLASIINHQFALENFFGSWNHLGEEGFIDLLPAFQTCRDMKELYLAGMGATCQSNHQPSFATVLASLPQLRKLKMGENKIGDKGFPQLAPGLQECAQLRYLSLYACGLTSNGSSMPLLTSVLFCLPQLTEIYLGENLIGDAGLHQLSIGLERCSQLIILSLVQIGMTSSQSVLTISRLLAQLDCLARLYLGGNTCEDSRCDWEFCAAVKVHPSLRELYPPWGMSEDTISLLDSFVEDSNCVLREICYW